MPLNPNQHPERLEVTSAVEKKVAYCRCWQSKQFPYCDGSHRHYNEANGDQLGPLIVLPEASDA